MIWRKPPHHDRWIGLAVQKAWNPARATSVESTKAPIAGIAVFFDRWKTQMTLVSDHWNTTNPTTGDTPETEMVPSERVWDILKSIDIAMLVTTSANGLRGRPMSTIPTPDKGLIYILTESTSSAATDIGSDGNVLLSYQGSGDHVALQGKATIDPDADLVAQLWNPGAQIFWPNGPQTHNVVTLVIDPGHADVWDGHGILRGIANIVRSAISGKSPDLGTRGVVDL